MNSKKKLDFANITETIEHIRENFKEQPTLDKTIEYAKKVLKESLLSDTIRKTKFSATNPTHDPFVKIEAMTLDEYKNGGKNLSINYSFLESIFGEIIMASTSKGVCYMAFADNQTIAFANLKEKFPNANYNQISDDFQQNATSIFTYNCYNCGEIKLHLKGTDFQLKVWETLLKIPLGELTTYGNIASKLNNPNASRAVGTAIGNNPVSILIPCHRVVRSSGALGGYHWGLTRKIAIIGWEAIKKECTKNNIY